jgi:hypothetical protein
MFDGREQHQSFVLVAAGLCVTGAVLITVSLFRMYLVEDACYGPLIMSFSGAALFLLGIGVGAYIKHRMTL